MEGDLKRLDRREKHRQRFSNEISSAAFCDVIRGARTRKLGFERADLKICNKIAKQINKELTMSAFCIGV